MPADKTASIFDHYLSLRRLAQSMIRFEAQCTLSATGLVHELYLKFRRQKNGANEEADVISPQFASRMMRQILIDRARSRISRKKLETAKGKPLSETENRDKFQLERLLDFEDLLARLSKELPENAELVRLHVYAGLSIEECAENLGLSRATAYRKWQFSKGWLQVRLK